MMRALGFLVATVLVFAGVAQAISNGFAPNGLTIIITGIGLAVAVLAWVCDVADEETSARLSAVDDELREKGL